MLIHLPKERRKEARNTCKALQYYTAKKLEKACRRCSFENTARCPKFTANAEPATVISFPKLSLVQQPIAVTS